MGKLTENQSESGASASSPSPLAESAASISLSTTTFPSDHYPPPSHRYFDEDPSELSIDDLPPLYTDHEEFNADDAAPFDPLMPSSVNDDGGFATVQSFRHDDVATYFVDARLDRDPDFLTDHINKLAMVPPRPFVHIQGHHSEKSRSSDKNRSSTSTVTDFSIEIELTHLLYSDIRATQAWRTLNATGNFEKVRRGTVFATRAPGFGGSGNPEEGVPGLREWCRRYCASRAGLKCFTMERRVEGYDWDMLHRRLHGLVRATNYRGHVKIKFPVKHSHVHIYNDCRVNRWRLTRWIAMMFMFTLMFIFTWPFLFFGTKRWETITTEWKMSKPTSVPGRKQYVSMSEEQWYQMWAGTIQKAMLDRRQGQLDQGDLDRTRAEAAGEVPRPEGFAGVMQAGMDAMGVVNRSFGWGGDQY